MKRIMKQILVAGTARTAMTAMTAMTARSAITARDAMTAGGAWVARTARTAIGARDARTARTARTAMVARTARTVSTARTARTVSTARTAGTASKEVYMLTHNQYLLLKDIEWYHNCLDVGKKSNAYATIQNLRNCIYNLRRLGYIAYVSGKSNHVMMTDAGNSALLEYDRSLR